MFNHKWKLLLSISSLLLMVGCSSDKKVEQPTEQTTVETVAEPTAATPAAEAPAAADPALDSLLAELEGL